MKSEITYQPTSGDFDELIFDYESDFKGKDWT